MVILSFFLLSFSGRKAYCFFICLFLSILHHRFFFFFFFVITARSPTNSSHRAFLSFFFLPSPTCYYGSCNTVSAKQEHREKKRDEKIKTRIKNENNDNGDDGFFFKLARILIMATRTLIPATTQLTTLTIVATLGLIIVPKRRRFGSTVFMNYIANISTRVTPIIIAIIIIIIIITVITTTQVFTTIITAIIDIVIVAVSLVAVMKTAVNNSIQVVSWRRICFIVVKRGN